MAGEGDFPFNSAWSKDRARRYGRGLYLPLPSVPGANNGLVTDAFETFFFGPAAAPSNDISGTATLTVAPAATLTGLGAISGSSSLTFAPVATLIGRGAVAGSAPLTFTAAAALAGVGPLTGSALLTFAPTGALTGLGAISGATDLTVSTSATLSNAGAVIDPIAGTSAVTFSTAGTLTGVDAIAGQAAVSFSTAGALTDASSGVDPISGTSSLVFAASGALENNAPQPLFFGMAGPPPARRTPVQPDVVVVPSVAEARITELTAQWQTAIAKATSGTQAARVAAVADVIMTKAALDAAHTEFTRQSALGQLTRAELAAEKAALDDDDDDDVLMLLLAA